MGGHSATIPNISQFSMNPSGGDSPLLGTSATTPVLPGTTMNMNTALELCNKTLLNNNTTNTKNSTTYTRNHSQTRSNRHRSPSGSHSTTKYKSTTSKTETTLTVENVSTMLQSSTAKLTLHEKMMRWEVDQSSATEIPP